MEILVGNTVAEEMAKLENDNEYVMGHTTIWLNHLKKSHLVEAFQVRF